jgi:hypothetical protein
VVEGGGFDLEDVVLEAHPVERRPTEWFLDETVRRGAIGSSLPSISVTRWRRRSRRSDSRCSCQLVCTQSAMPPPEQTERPSRARKMRRSWSKPMK